MPQADRSAVRSIGILERIRCRLWTGYGYMVEYPVSRAFVDARVNRTYGGTSLPGCTNAS